MQSVQVSDILQPMILKIGTIGFYLVQIRVEF